MDDISPPEAKSVSAGVRTIPFRMSALDGTLGGLPSGATTLLAGAPDASADAFVYLTLGHGGRHTISAMDEVLDSYQFETDRTMRVGSFGGALDREEQTVYRTSIGGTGFRVSTTKKLAPSNW